MELSSEKQQHIFPDSTTAMINGKHDYIILNEDGAGIQMAASTGGIDPSLTDLMLGKHNFFLTSVTETLSSNQRSSSLPGRENTH
jgi:hypothetical protein